MVNGMVARRMRSLLHQAGFVDITIVPEAVAGSDGSAYGWMADTVGKGALATNLDPEIVEGWMEDQRRRISEDRFFFASTHFVTCARRP
jgi:hypothetical protein